METRRLLVGGRALILRSVAVAEQVQAEIESAVRLGGGFVDVRLADDSVIAVLATPCSTVFIEPYEVHEQGTAGDDLAGFLDYDFEPPTRRSV